MFVIVGLQRTPLLCSTLLCLGGLDEEVTVEILHAAFIPFGDIVEVNIPKDFKESKHPGLANYVLSTGWCTPGDLRQGDRCLASITTLLEVSWKGRSPSKLCD